jgi:hypothetical protein
MASPTVATAAVGRENSLRLGVHRSPRWLGGWRGPGVDCGNRQLRVWRRFAPPAEAATKKRFRVCEIADISFVLLVGERGFEPPTPWSRIGCRIKVALSGSEAQAASALGEKTWAQFWIERISGEDEAG